MSDILDPQQAASDAAARIAGHQTQLRRRYPQALAQLQHFVAQRGTSPGLNWPDWCWLPMAGAAAIVQDAGLPDPADIARVAAVGQWTLAGRHLVLPDEQVTTLHVPDAYRPGMDAAEMDLIINREHLLAELDRRCFYLASPVGPEEVAEVPVWSPAGLYVHLEHDVNTGRAELRMLLDHDRGWDQLTPVFVHIDQPTLAWSTRDAAQSIASTAVGLPVPADAIARMVRTLAFLAWPLLAALLDTDTTLTGPSPLPGQGTRPALMRGTQVWRLATGRRTLRTV